MKSNQSRREFLRMSTGAACIEPLASLNPSLSGIPCTATARLDGNRHIKKAVQIDMLPKTLSYADRFKLARDVGFEGVEGQTVEDPRIAEEIKTASEALNCPFTRL
jgi:hypothetical protein